MKVVFGVYLMICLSEYFLYDFPVSGADYVQSAFRLLKLTIVKVVYKGTIVRLRAVR